jgi:AcrR family transcriptional regulator
MANFREIRFAEKKEDIFNIAAEIFLQKGYEKTTLEEIAAELRMTRGNIYHYFQSKEDILFQSLMRAYAIAYEVLSQVAERKDLTPKERLAMAIKEHTKVLTKKFVYATMRQQDLFIPEEWRQAVIEERDKCQEIYMGFLKEGINDKIFQEQNIKIVCFAILGAVNWIARWYSPDGPMTAEEIGEATANYLVGRL